MATTLVAPTSTQQINNTYYVGEGYLTSIQTAVTVAVASGTQANVIIPQGYAGGDAVASVTGGSANVYVIDERHGQRQSYLWYNNAYIYLSIHPRGGVLTPQLNNYAYVGYGTNATIQGVIDAFALLPALTITIIVESSYTGSEIITELTGGDPGIVISDQRTDEWQNYRWDGTHFIPSNVVIGGDLSVAGDLNVGGDLYGTDAVLTGNLQADSAALAGNFEIGGDATIAGALSAGDTSFATCLVDESPVRTFANTPDGGGGGGMVWPDIGIAVSAGDHWESPSIDPVTLATWPGAGIAVSSGTAWETPSIDPATLATWPAAGVPVSTGEAWGTPSIDPATLATWPAAGVPVSTGEAWGTPIPAADIALLSSQSVIFSGDLAADRVNIINAVDTSSHTLLNVFQTMMWPEAITGINVGINGNPLNFVQLGFQFIGQGSQLNLGVIGFPGGQNATFNNIGEWIFPTNITANAGLLTLKATSAATIGATLRQSTDTNFHINAQTGGNLLFNWDVTAGTFFGNGAAASVASITSAGDAQFTSVEVGGTVLNSGGLNTPNSVVAGFVNVGGSGIQSVGAVVSTDGFYTPGAKAFRIVHPLDDTKTLTHASLEGPEIAVYYRGEGETVNGLATITLPDYFEALTMKENRTVQLTELYEDEAEPMFGNFLAAGRVKDSRFTVRSSTGSVKFYWEVKAVRSDIAPLIVEQPKQEAEDDPEFTPH